MHMYRDVWAAGQDVRTRSEVHANTVGRIEPALGDFIDEHHLRVVGDVDDVQTHHVALLGRELIGFHLEEESATEALMEAEQRLQDHKLELFEFCGSITSKIATIETLDDSGPIRRLSRNEYEDVGWTKRASGTIQPTMRTGVLRLKGIGFWERVWGYSYFTHPINEDGNPLIRLTIDE